MLNYLRLIPTLFIFLFFSCNKDNSLYEVEQADGTDFLNFQLVNSDDGNVYSSFLIGDSAIHVKVPNGVNLSSLKLNFTINGEKVLMGNTEIRNNARSIDFSDFAHSISFNVVSSKGDTKKYTVNLYDIPVLIINTPDGLPITTKEYRTEGCTCSLIDKNGTICNLGTAGVKGRGNSTWLQPKKPYNLKFDEKQDLLGMGKSKHWVLLSQPYYDRTQLHNATAFEMARLTDYHWVPKGEFAELILNGNHQGLYYICEKIRVESGRIEIGTPLKDDYLNGGYLLESAFHNTAENRFQTDYFNKTDAAYPLFWEINDPDNPSLSAVEKCKSDLNHIECLIKDSIQSGAYRSLLDIETAINWFLVNEVALNPETLNPSNLFLYKKEGDNKMYFGAPWDFDAWTFGFNMKNHMYLLRSTFYYHYLLQDPIFVSRLKEKWNVLKLKWSDKIPTFIKEQSSYIKNAAERNETMWPIWHALNYYPEKTRTEIVENMISSFKEQLLYVDSQIESF